MTGVELAPKTTCSRRSLRHFLSDPLGNFFFTGRFPLWSELGPAGARGRFPGVLPGDAEVVLNTRGSANSLGRGDQVRGVEPLGAAVRETRSPLCEGGHA